MELRYEELLDAIRRVGNSLEVSLQSFNNIFKPSNSGRLLKYDPSEYQIFFEGEGEGEEKPKKSPSAEDWESMILKGIN